MASATATTPAAAGADKAPLVSSTPPTTPRGPRNNLGAGQAQLDNIGGAFRVQLRFLSALTVETKVDKSTTISDLRAGLLRITGASVCTDEAIILDATGKLFEDPWDKPFSGLSGDGEIFEVIVRKAQTSYYRDMADRRG